MDGNDEDREQRLRDRAYALTDLTRQRFSLQCIELLSGEDGNGVRRVMAHGWRWNVGALADNRLKQRSMARIQASNPLSLSLDSLTKWGNRIVSARLLGVSVRTLRNKISEYSAESLDIPRHERRDVSTTLPAAVSAA
jgi:hypothetical protein